MVTTRGGGGGRRSWVKVRATSQARGWRTAEADGQAPTDPPYVVGNQTSLPGTRLIAASPKGDGELALGLDTQVAVCTLSRALFPEPRLDAAQTGAPWSPLPQHADPGWLSGVGDLHGGWRAPWDHPCLSPALSPSSRAASPRPPRACTHTRAHSHTHSSHTRPAQTPPRPRPGPCGRPLRRPRTPARSARLAGGGGDSGHI